MEYYEQFDFGLLSSKWHVEMWRFCSDLNCETLHVDLRNYIYVIKTANYTMAHKNRINLNFLKKGDICMNKPMT